MGRTYRVCFLLATLVMVLAIGAFAQSFTATMSGNVKDQTGAVLPGVQVTAVNPATGLTRPVVTNERGDFVIPLLPVGTYEVKAELPGFQTEVRQRILLQVDQRVSVNFELRVGELTERLLVTEAAPLVQSETSDVGGVIENRRVVDLPLNGRQFENLALLVPGAMNSAPGSNNGFRGGIAVAGARERDTGFILDGIDLLGNVVHSVAFRPSIDAIQEFKVQTTRYSAELGRQAGGQVNVTTKAGTNEFHGTLYEFVRNHIFDAKNFFDPPDEPIPGFKRNNFGGTIGGPIRRDRTFFFGNYEGLRLRQSITKTATVPTPAMVAGDFSQLGAAIRDPLTGQPFPGSIIPQNRIDRIGQIAARWYPQPNLPGSVRNFVSTPIDKRRIDQFTTRIDHRFSDRNSFFARYTFNDDLELDPFDVYNGITNLPGYGRVDDQYGHSLSIVDTHIFNPSLVGEFRIGFNRFFQFRSVYPESQRDIAGELGIPGVTKEPINFGFPTFFLTGYDALGKDGLPSDRHDNTYQAVGSLTWILGNHTLKFGHDVAWLNSDRINNSNSRGVFRFSGQYSGNALADLLLGFPRQTQRTLGDSQTGPRALVLAHYLQDDWKVTPRLTLNLGVRYDWQPKPFSTNDRYSRFNPETGAIEITGTASTRRDIARPDNPLSDNYSPELAALAQSVKFVDLGRRNIVSLDLNDIAPRLGLAYRVLGNDRLVLRTGYGIYYNEHQLAWGFGADTYPFKVAQTFIANATQPNIMMGNPFPGALATATISPKASPVELRTMYVQQYNLGFQYQPVTDFVIDIGYVGNKSTKLPETRNLNQPLPSLSGSVASRRPYAGFGNISLSEVTGNAHFDSLQLRVEKRYTEGLTLMSAYTWSKSIDYSSAGASNGDVDVQDHYNIRGGQRGLSGFDARHRLVFSYIYELPFGSGQRFFTNTRGFGNWLVSGWQISGISLFQSGRPFSVRIRADNSNTGAAGTDRPNLVGNPNLPGGERSPDRWFNTQAFAIPLRGTFGNVGRNTMIGPGLNNTDFSLTKNSRIGESKNLQFRAEFFNLANHPNFDFPNRDADSPQFGRIFSAQFSRQIQFGLKLIY